MDWDNIIPIIIALLAVIGLPIALLSRKKGGPEKIDELYQHFRGMGLKISRLEEESEGEKLGRKRSWGERSEGLFEIQDRNIDFISIVSVSSQYGVNYYLEHLVKSTGQILTGGRKKTKMVKKKSPRLWGKVMDIEWRGDPHLSQRLNFDYQLKYRLLQADTNALKKSITIIPETKYGHTRIRTEYQLPSPEMFEVLDSIARHVKTWA